jgi:hypothetical protein
MDIRAGERGCHQFDLLCWIKLLPDLYQKDAPLRHIALRAAIIAAGFGIMMLVTHMEHWDCGDSCGLLTAGSRVEKGLVVVYR